MNCLKLKHEQDAKIRAWEMTTNIKELKKLEKRLIEIREIFNTRHNEYYPDWKTVENCNCK